MEGEFGRFRRSTDDFGNVPEVGGRTFRTSGDDEVFQAFHIGSSAVERDERGSVSFRNASDGSISDRRFENSHDFDGLHSEGTDFVRVDFYGDGVRIASNNVERRSSENLFNLVF